MWFSRHCLFLAWDGVLQVRPQPQSLHRFFLFSSLLFSSLLFSSLLFSSLLFSSLLFSSLLFSSLPRESSISMGILMQSCTQGGGATYDNCSLSFRRRYDAAQRWNELPVLEVAFSLSCDSVHASMTLWCEFISGQEFVVVLNCCLRSQSDCYMESIHYEHTKDDSDCSTISTRTSSHTASSWSLRLLTRSWQEVCKLTFQLVLTSECRLKDRDSSLIMAAAKKCSSSRPSAQILHELCKADFVVTSCLQKETQSILRLHWYFSY